MRCASCDTPLTPFERTRKNARTGEYLDLCDDCFEPIKNEVEVVERYDLYGQDDTDSASLSDDI